MQTTIIEKAVMPISIFLSEGFHDGFFSVMLKTDGQQVNLTKGYIIPLNDARSLAFTIANHLQIPFNETKYE